MQDLTWIGLLLIVAWGTHNFMKKTKSIASTVAQNENAKRVAGWAIKKWLK